MNSLLVIVAASILIGAFWRFVGDKPWVRALSVVASLAVLWYVIYYDTPENRAYRALNSGMEKFQQKVTETFNPDQPPTPGAWERTMVGICMGWKTNLQVWGLYDPPFAELNLLEEPDGSSVGYGLKEEYARLLLEECWE